MIKRLLFFLPVALLFFSSCKRDDEKAQWETQILTPLFKSSLNLNNIISDTLLQSGADSSLSVVYENHLYDMNIDSIFNLYDTSVTRSYNLDSISLLNQSVSYPVSLGQICLNDGSWVGPFIISSNGSSITIPAISNIAPNPFVINLDTLFTTMTLVTGFLDISIYNGLPIDITNVSFELKNTSNSTIIASGLFPLIAVGTTETQSISLAGKTIEGDLTGQLLSLSSPGSSGGLVLIDTSNSLIASLSIHDLHPSTATAIFPTQNLINQAQAFKFHFNSVEMKEAKIKSGNVVMDLYSTLQDSVHFIYNLPSATHNGTGFAVSTTLPPAPSGGVSHFYHVYDFTGYRLDLSGPNHDTVNTMYNEFIARVDSTGIMKTLSLTDSIYANIGFSGLTPSYARGYIGQQTYDIGPSQLLIDIFKNITGTLQLQDVHLNITAENGIGADAQININNLSSYNSRTGHSVVLTGAAVNNPINIVRATDAGGSPPVNSTITTLQLDASNSNTPAFISNLPDRLNYSMSILTNPNGNVSNYQDFVYDDKLLKFNLNVQMPLSFVANDLTLSDTVDFSLNKADISRIKDGVLTLNADNGFPFDAEIQFYPLDMYGRVVDSLFANTIIAAAPLDANYKVKEKKRSKLIIPVNEQRINTFFNTTKMKIVVRFNTKPVNTFVKIYSDYTIDLQLTGDFNYIAN